MSKKLGSVIAVIAVIALCLSAVDLYLALKPVEKPYSDVQYVLFLGTNDKDTNEPVFPVEEAITRLKSILIRSFGGYTIQEANGGWIDDAGVEYQEYTLMIYLSDTTAEKVHILCDELLEVFNQNSILIQADSSATEFYSGK